MGVRFTLGLAMAFAAGIAVGLFVSGTNGAECVSAADADLRAGRHGPTGFDAADAAALKAAQKRIGELERRIAALTARSKSLLPGKKTESDDIEARLAGVQTNLDEELAKKLPAEEFRKVKEAFEKMRAARAKRARGRIEFLSSIELSDASKEDRKTHEDYLKLIAEQEALMSNAKGIIPDPKTLEKLIALQVNTKPIADSERRLLLSQMVVNMGYTGADADVVVGTVEDIIRATAAGGIGGALGAADEDMGREDADGPAVEVQTQVMTLWGPKTK